MNDTSSAFVLLTGSDVTVATWALVVVTVLLAVATWQLVLVTRHHNERHEARLEFKSTCDVTRDSVRENHIKFDVEIANAGWQHSAIRYSQVQSSSGQSPQFARKVNLFPLLPETSRNTYIRIEAGELTKFQVVWEDFERDASFEDLLKNGFVLHVTPVLGNPLAARIEAHDTSDSRERRDHPRLPRLVKAKRIDIPELFENA